MRNSFSDSGIQLVARRHSRHRVINPEDAGKYLAGSFFGLNLSPADVGGEVLFDDYDDNQSTTAAHGNQPQASAGRMEEIQAFDSGNSSVQSVPNRFEENLDDLIVFGDDDDDDDHVSVRDDEDDEADGEFVATTEADTFDLDSPAMGKKQGALVLYSKYTDVSYQLLRASAPSVEDFLVNWVGRGYAKTLNGLLLTEVAANGTAFKTFASATAIAFGEPEGIVGNNDLSGYMDDEAALAWVMRSSTHWDIKSIVGSDRQYAVNVDNGKSLLGYPVHYSQKATATAASAKDVYFGNWQYVAHAEGNRLTFMRDPYTVAVKGQIRLLWFFEADFQVTQAEAIGYGVHPSA